MSNNKTKYKSNNRINLTFLKYQDRKRVGKKSSGKAIEEFHHCPYCKSDKGYYIESLTESLVRSSFDFNHNQNNFEPEKSVSNLIWKNKHYICINCGKAIAEVKIE